MNTNATLEQMKELRFSGMATTYAQQLELPIHQQLDAHELIAQLLQSEQLFRSQEKTTYYLKQGENILVTGATGCGKSYLACALGYQCCQMGMKTTYFSMNRFIEKITLSKLDGSYLKLLNHLERQALIILDDFGLQPMQQDVKLALLQILEERHGKRSTLITSQLPVSAWHEYIHEPTVADAIMDRLTAGAHRIELKGESLRRKK